MRQFKRILLLIGIMISLSIPYFIKPKVRKETSNKYGGYVDTIQKKANKIYIYRK